METKPETQSTSETQPEVTRRKFLTGAALAAGAAGIGAASYFVAGPNRVSRSHATKVIVIGIDGMDPRLSKAMMAAGDLPNLAKMTAGGGFSSLGTSIPPQSPVAWSNFINGSGPGSHGIFDFIHRHPHDQCARSFRQRKRFPVTVSWNGATTICSLISGRLTTSRRKRCFADKAFRSGIFWTRNESIPFFTTCRRTILPARQDRTR